MIEGGAQVRGLCASCLAATLPVFPSAPTHLVLDIFGYFAP